jgi:hypothetical protein
MVGAILECAAAMGYLIFRFYIFSWERAAIIGNGVNTPSNLPEVNDNFGGGVFMMAEFILTPINAFLLYLFFEGSDTGRSASQTRLWSFCRCMAFRASTG